ncbi:hypothetical protein HYC85_029009 [Camellia sinensis]|uniref:Uncharacterized protein n=1 Tax=Camellia sinensis TaxID=4442 RepID=A0A7J7FZ31_CAMSI|nr:hypothetical protein HYC85_029009 [Camellia sinensis]
MLPRRKKTKEDDEISEDDDEIDGEELQQAYEKLYRESPNLSRLNDKLTIKLKAYESKNVKLKEEVSKARKDAIKISSDKQALCAKLLSCEIKRNELLKINATYEDKIESLEMS